MTITEDTRETVYTCLTPEKALPVVFDSPHSGRIYPEDFDYGCDFSLLQRAEDNYVEELFDRAPETGATLLYAHFPRTYIDANRSADEIDPALLADSWPGDINATGRVQAGIGLIRRLIQPGTPLYNRLLTSCEIRHRIDTYYTPYHDALAARLDILHARFGQVWHINCHSMPALKHLPVLPRGAFAMLPGQPDFVLGDRDGTSCHLAFTHALRDFLKDLGYRVAVNNIYKGVELVRRHGRPAEGRHSLQLEINKALYWDENKGRKAKHFAALKHDIGKLADFIAAYAGQNLTAMAAD